jgi:hypothetical protein
MNNTPRLTRSIPFWVLLVGSLASVGFGTWLTFQKLGTMTSTLQDGSATGVEVYAGQSWAVFAAAFVGAGLVGLVAVLALAVARSFAARPVEVVEAIAWSDDEEPLDETVTPATAEPVTAEPVTAGSAAAVSPAADSPATEERITR